MGIIQDFWGYTDINFNIMQFSQDLNQHSTYGSEKTKGNLTWDYLTVDSRLAALCLIALSVLKCIIEIIIIYIILGSQFW